MPNINQNVQSGYPLSALFVLLAVSSVISALLSPVVRAVTESELLWEHVAVASVLGAILVAMLGGTIGLYHYRPLRGAGWGVLTGGVIGAVVGPVMLAPAEAIVPLVAMSFGGSIVLLITGAAIGFSTND